jgi:hypothetical protein
LRLLCIFVFLLVERPFCFGKGIRVKSLCVESSSSLLIIWLSIDAGCVVDVVMFVDVWFLAESRAGLVLLLCEGEELDSGMFYWRNSLLVWIAIGGSGWELSEEGGWDD